MERRLSERLSAIESTLRDRLLLVESSLEHAHNTISDLKSDLSGIKTELVEVRAEKRRSDIMSEHWSNEFNLLFHGLPTAGVPNLFTILYHLGSPCWQRVPLLPEQVI